MQSEKLKALTLSVSLPLMVMNQNYMKHNKQLFDVKAYNVTPCTKDTFLVIVVKKMDPRNGTNTQIVIRGLRRIRLYNRGLWKPSEF